jgi:hypothetical protein
VATSTKDAPTVEECAALRALGAAVEPLVGSVYFAPECHAEYAKLGFGPGAGTVGDEGWAAEHWGKVQLPDSPAYFCSRGSMMGQVPGEVIAAAFGVFNPEAVIPSVALGWRITDADTIWAARERGATAQITRVLGERPEGIERATALLERAGEDLGLPGRPMYAGLVGRGVPQDPIGRLRRHAERLREFRGDAHVAAWSGAGFDGCEIQFLTERHAGMPMRAYVLGRGWSPADVDRAEATLTARGLLAGGETTAAGAAAREQIEVETDRLCLGILERLGDDLPELVALLRAWAPAIRAAAAYYPSSPQEAVMTESVQEWMDAHGLERFAGARRAR